MCTHIVFSKHVYSQGTLSDSDHNPNSIKLTKVQTYHYTTLTLQCSQSKHYLYQLSLYALPLACVCMVSILVLKLFSIQDILLVYGSCIFRNMTIYIVKWQTTQFLMSMHACRYVRNASIQICMFMVLSNIICIPAKIYPCRGYNWGEPEGFLEFLYSYCIAVCTCTCNRLFR